MSETTKWTGGYIAIDESNSPGKKDYAPGTAYSCEAHLRQLPDGSYRAIAAKLPQIEVEAGTLREALDLLGVAFGREITKRKQENGQITWAAERRQPESGELVRWVTAEVS